MDTLEQLFAHYGLLAVFLGVLCDQIGMPAPALPILLLAGAHGLHDGRFAALALALAVVASMFGGMAWYGAGRLMGRRVLDLMCRVSMSPDTCVRKSELSFARRGGGTLVLGKFIPGIAVMAPPLAGALGMPLLVFAGWQLLGALTWVAVDMLAGALFHRQVLALIASLGEMGGVALPLIGALLAAYLAFRLWRRWSTHRALAHLPRVTPHELAELLAGPRPPIVVDVRTAVGGEMPECSVPGARQLELVAIPEFPLNDWPEDTLVVTYCACPQDATAARAAAQFAKRGIAARVLSGGIDGWQVAGLELSPHPPVPLRHAKSGVGAPATRGTTPSVAAPVIGQTGEP